MLQKTVKISVTKGDIDNGLQSSSTRCPIAYAARRVFKTGAIYVNWNIDVGDSTYMIPESADRFIEKFDEGHSIKPFTFTAQLKKEY